MPPAIRDIIDIPVVTTVVRLSDTGDAGCSEGLVRDFVMTGQVEKNLRSIAQSVSEGKGRGYFLIGAYGSGKSHFLSYISLVASGEIAVGGRKCPLAESLGERRLMPVRISLLSARGSSPLEDAILAGAEAAFRSLGSPVKLTRRSRFIEFVGGAVRAVDAGGMDRYLASNRLGPWDELLKDADRASVAAWGYLKTLPTKPAVPDISPDRLLMTALGGARSLGFDGILIVIDELSEFLRSKPSRNALGDDARYLQLMGEMAQAEPLWIVASLQESIEQTGDIARGVITKIKDRYPVRLALDGSHVRELIDGRLIRKREGAREAIRIVWQRFTDALPHFECDFESFYRIYPVHPDTIRYLEDLAWLFSANRGVVDFIVSEVRGDPERGNAGILDKGCETLVTADRIYTHFRDRIREDNRFAEFDTKVRTDILRAAEKLFTDKYDRELGVRAADILILDEISGGAKPKSVSDLVKILLCAVTDVSPVQNEEYLSEVILLPLLRESLYMRISQGKSAGEHIFRISMERDSRALFGQEMKQALEGIPDGDLRVFRDVLEKVPTSLPVQELFRGVNPEIAVSWRGTHRKGLIFSADAPPIEEMVYKVDEGDYDFGLIIAFAEAGPPLRQNLPRNFLIWAPSWEKDDVSAIREYVAASALANRDAPNAGMRIITEEAQRAVDEGQGAIAKIIEGAYRRGAFVGAAFEKPAGGGRYGTKGFLEQCSEEAITQLLSRCHPRFIEVAPQLEFISKRLLAPLVDAIMVPGRISMAAARKGNVLGLIEGVLIPMGLARTSGSSFVMQIDPAQSPLVREIMGMAEGGDVRIADLSRSLRRGPFGLTRDLIGLIVVAMTRGGMVELRKGGRRIPAAVVGFSQFEEAEEMRRGELIDPELRERFFKDTLLSDGIDRSSFSLTIQREAWERLAAFRARFMNVADRVGSKLGELSQYPILDSFDFERVRTAIEAGNSAMSDISETLPSSKGLAKYLSGAGPDLKTIMAELEAVLKFIDEDFEQAIRIADYIKGVPTCEGMPEDISDALEETRAPFADLTGFVLSGQIGSVKGSFDRFHRRYVEWYIEEHRKAFARERFAPFEKVREDPAYRALSAVGLISGINLADSAQSIDYRVASVLSGRCQSSPSAELRLRPVCSCAFRPGHAPEIGDASAIEAAAAGGIGEAIDAFLDGAVREKIISRMAALRDTDPDAACRLEKFLNCVQKGVTAGEFTTIMTPEMARLVDCALKLQVTVFRRRIGDLAERLAGRRLSPVKIRSMVDEWLGDISGDEVVIDLSEGGEDIWGGLAGWIADHGLDEAHARMTLHVPSDARPVEDDSEISVDEAKLQKMCDLVGLVRAAPDECLKILGREKRSKAFAWRVARRLAVLSAEGQASFEEKDILCRFEAVSSWLRLVDIAARPLPAGDARDVIALEAGREYAISRLEEDYLRQGNTTSVEFDKIMSVVRRAVSERNALFDAVGLWDIRFDDIVRRFGKACIIFVDAARWDIAHRLCDIVWKETGRGLTEKTLYTISGASTEAWQSAFFGVLEADAVSTAVRRQGFAYYGGVEDSAVRAQIREEGGRDSSWLHVGLIDNMIHATALPLYRVIEDVLRSFSELMKDISPYIPKESPIIMMSDHGFSEWKGRRGVPAGSSRPPRYRHDPKNPADRIATMAVFGKRAG